MYYHYSTLLLFWPVAGLNIFDAGLVPHHICTQAANAIGTIIKSYARLYSLRRTPSFVPYFALSAAIVHLDKIVNPYEHNSAGPPTEGTKSTAPSDISAFSALDQVVSSLQEMKQCHLLADKALKMLSILTEKWGVGILIDAGTISLQDCIEVCWPYNRGVQYHPPRGLGEAEGTLRMAQMTINCIKHPLFLPLLALKHPTDLTEDSLRQTGFSLIR